MVRLWSEVQPMMETGATPYTPVGSKRVRKAMKRKELAGRSVAKECASY
jgi:hypothetical protein